MEIEKLQEILDKHAKWLNNEAGGVRANLHGANLWNANLRDADLRGADLRHTNLQYADLWYANLRGVNLRGAYLHDVNFQGAFLQDADLSFANLQHANLQDANLHFADLQYVNLQDANLQGALFNWVNWHEAENIKVYVAGLQSSRDNAQLTYIPSIDVAITGCWQGSWQATIERIHSVYADGTRERKAYDLAIEYIENQMALDDVETAK